MRLTWRLIWSHGMLAMILLVGVAITLAGLMRMNDLIAEVKDDLAEFEQQENLHRAAWAIETAARHGMAACEADPGAEANVEERLRRAAARLHRSREGHDRVEPRMTAVARGYEQFVTHVTEEDTCSRLQATDVARRRLALEEELTDAWMNKLHALRLTIDEKEASAQRTGALAVRAGVTLGLLALTAAVVAARWMARGVTDPLQTLSGHAARVGEGDFSPLPSIRGPYEVQQLHRDLDGMRARLAELDQLKQAFLASVSHDLRTPLAHLREALGLLSDGTTGPLNSRQQRVVSLAYRACEREIRLVSALLDLSRIRAGRPVQRKEGQRIDEVIDNAIEHVRDAAGRADVRVVVDRTAAVPPAPLDTVLVESAIVNVLTNAISASGPDAAVEVERIVTSEGPPGADGTRAGSWLRIVIRDHGPGVPAEVQGRLFEPFFTRPTRPGSRYGVGLGLPLAREMVRAHGGDVAFLELSGSGAAFAIWLPLSDDSENEEHAAKEVVSLSS